VNAETLMALIKLVNAESVWGSKSISNSGTTYLTAKDFGQINSTGNGQIVVKLLDDAVSSTNPLNKASQQYWQVVYRSINNNEDVLTLYMVDQYISAQFNPSSSDVTNGNNVYNGETYYHEGNYIQSYLRDKTVLPLYEAMKNTYSKLDDYVVAPNAVPGHWQSAQYQTARNSSKVYYNQTAINGGSNEMTTASYGASGYRHSDKHFGIVNGLDENNAVWKTTSASWISNTTEGAYTDKLWVPSGFEVLHTGYGVDNTQTIQDTGRTYDNANAVSYVADYNDASTTLSENSRTGLWELNGFDRSNGSVAWLRSGYSYDTFYGRSIRWNGSYGNYDVYNSYGVRVALHLDIKTLANEYLSMNNSTELPPVPIYTTRLAITNNTTSNALLFITSEDDDTFTYHINAGNNTIDLTLPNFIIGRLYVIRTYNATLSGTLTPSGGATVSSANAYYTFQCDTIGATISLSGLTIS